MLCDYLKSIIDNEKIEKTQCRLAFSWLARANNQSTWVNPVIQKSF